MFAAVSTIFINTRPQTHDMTWKLCNMSNEKYFPLKKEKRKKKPCEGQVVYSKW